MKQDRKFKITSTTVVYDKEDKDVIYFEGDIITFDEIERLISIGSQPIYFTKEIDENTEFAEELLKRLINNSDGVEIEENILSFGDKYMMTVRANEHRGNIFFDLSEDLEKYYHDLVRRDQEEYERTLETSEEE